MVVNRLQVAVKLLSFFFFFFSISHSIIYYKCCDPFQRVIKTIYNIIKNNEFIFISSQTYEENLKYIYK